MRWMAFATRLLLPCCSAAPERVQIARTERILHAPSGIYLIVNRECVTYERTVRTRTHSGGRLTRAYYMRVCVSAGKSVEWSCTLHCTLRSVSFRGAHMHLTPNTSISFVHRVTTTTTTLGSHPRTWHAPGAPWSRHGARIMLRALCAVRELSKLAKGAQAALWSSLALDARILAFGLIGQKGSWKIVWHLHIVLRDYWVLLCSGRKTIVFYNNNTCIILQKNA